MNRSSSCSQWKGLLAAVYLLPIMAVAQENGLIQIVSPTPNQVVKPGETVPLIVVVDPSLSPTQVVFMAEFSSGIGPVEWTAEPYEAVIQIPDDAHGTIDYGVFADDGSDPSKFLSEQSGSLVVQVDEAPAEIHFVNQDFLFDYPDESSLPRTIQPFGIYSNGKRRPLYGSAAGTTFVSTNPAVVTVDAEGVMTPVGVGDALITVQNGTLKDWVAVAVVPEGDNYTPPVEVTSGVAISTGGIRWDPRQRVYVQSVYVTNRGEMPIPKPINVVVFDLPPEIVPVMGGGTVRLLPLGTPAAGVSFATRRRDPGSHSFARPGATGSTVLKFRNPKGVPVTHTLKVYYGNP